MRATTPCNGIYFVPSLRSHAGHMRVGSFPRHVTGPWTQRAGGPCGRTGPPHSRGHRGYLWREQPRVLPKSPIGGAIAYALCKWAALTRYTAEGDLKIYSAGGERSLRGVAVGWKNWLFSGSDTCGRTAAILLDPFTYLRDVFDRISAHPAHWLEELLPDRWQAAKTVTTASWRSLGSSQSHGSSQSLPPFGSVHSECVGENMWERG